MSLHARIVSIVLAALASAGAARGATVVDLAVNPDVVRIESLTLQDSLGSGDIIACDVDGDRIQDVVLGTPRADGVDASRVQCGEIYVVRGARRRWSGVHGILDIAAVRIVGQKPLHYFGVGVACADLNGDGLADIVGGADFSDSVGDSRSQAGQVHIVFGAPSLPALIDLAQPFGTLIYGAESPDGLGTEPATGDVNGDGTQDLLLDAMHATFAPTNQTQAGKIHVLFGRTTWPQTIDLRTGSDVTIRGVTKSDTFGCQLSGGDVDRDGTDELIVDASGSDRPGTSRLSSGSVYVWRGRRTWPPDVSLATAQPDLLIYGADAEDQVGRTKMHVVDWDQDGTPDLLLGAPYADGPANATSLQGELRSVEPGATWPATIDLRTTYSRVMYGIDANDRWCGRFQVGDVNGDGIPDVTCGAPRSSGPGETRPTSGEAATVYGREGLPADIRLANGEYDVIVYGAALQDELGTARFPTDINDDGLDEIAFRANEAVPGRLSEVYLVSPVDIDGDGLTQLADNCPLVYNPDQLDGDGDLRGDACATDWDGDGIGDAADCASKDRRAGRPGDVHPVSVQHDRASGSTTLAWPLLPAADRYDVSRGRIAELRAGTFGQCRTAVDPDPADGTFHDTTSPGAGDGFFYLVRGVDAGCGGAGTWGSGSSGVERVNTDPAACAP